MLNSPRKFSIASSIASPGSASVYYTPSEYPVPTVPSSYQEPRRCSIPRPSTAGYSRAPGSAGRRIQDGLSVPDVSTKTLTASTLSLAGSYDQSIDGDKRDTVIQKRLEDLGWLDENYNDLGLKMKPGQTLSMSSLTPLQRVAVKGFVSQRRKSNKFSRNSSQKSIYHNLIPEIYIHDTEIYKQFNENTDREPVFGQFIGQRDKGSNEELQEIEETYKQNPITVDNICIPEEDEDNPDGSRSADMFYGEINTHTDYELPPRRKSTAFSNKRQTPKLKMGMSPMALQRLFTTPLRTSVTKGRSSIPEVQWAPCETEYPKQYRSVLTGECVQPMTPNCSIFHGKALTSTAKIFRTLCLAYAYFVVGVCFSLLGPTLLDFTDRSNINQKEAYQFLTVRGAGVAVGSVLLGTVIHAIDNYVSFAVVLTLCGVANAVFPVLWTLTLMMLDEFIIGVCLGFLETGTQILCVDIWGYDNAPYMLVIHFVYGIGTITGPLIAQPFLREDNNMATPLPAVSLLSNTSTTQPHYSNFDETVYNTLPTQQNFTEYNFQYAYFILGGLFASCGVLKVIIWMSNGECMCRNTNDFYLKKSGGSPKNNDRTSLFVLTTIFMFLHVGIECSYKGFLAPFTVTEFDWSQSYGAWITAVVYTTYSFGRGVGIVMGKCLNPGTLMWINLTLMFAASLVELIVVPLYPVYMWMTASIQGLGQSTVLPACFMFASSRLHLQGISAGILMFTSSIGMMLIPGLTGWLMTSLSPKAFHVIPLIIISLNIIIFFIIYCLGKKVFEEYTAPPNDSQKSDETLHEKTNFRETTTSTRLSEVEKGTVISPSEESDLKSPIANLQAHTEYTGSPKTYIVNNTSFGSDVFSEIKCQSDERSFQRELDDNKEPPSARTLFKSPYSMNCYTPLALATFAKDNFGI